MSTGQSSLPLSYISFRSLINGSEASRILSRFWENQDDLEINDIQYVLPIESTPVIDENILCYWHQYFQSLRDIMSIDNTIELMQYQFALRNYNYNANFTPISDSFLSDITMKAVRNEYEQKDEDEECQADEVREENKGHKVSVGFDHSLLSDETSDDSGSHIYRNVKDHSWNNRFQELVEFVKENGHCNVPQKYLKNKALGRWLARQREQYRLRCKNEHSFLTTSRLRALESISKEWYTPYEQSTRNKCSKILFDEAKKNSEEKEVENEAKPQSSVWKMENTGGSKPNDDGEAELNDSWHKRFKDLLEFHQIFGHCNVPRRYAPNKTLGNWVNKQRCLYRKFYCEGKTSPLSQYRVDTLNDVGFLWSVRKFNEISGNSDISDMNAMRKKFRLENIYQKRFFFSFKAF